MVKPLLFLDVDGVLNPLHAGDLATGGPTDEPYFATFSSHVLRHPTGREYRVRPVPLTVTGCSASPTSSTSNRIRGPLRTRVASCDGSHRGGDVAASRDTPVTLP